MTQTHRSAPMPTLVATFRAVSALMLREMATTYGKSAGGYVWVLLEPILGIALLSAVFSLAFRSPSIGLNFPIFYATGMLPYLMYMDISRKVGSSINFSRPLLIYPAVTFLDAVIARFLLSLITHIIVFYVLITSIELLFDTNTVHDYRRIVLSFVMASVLGLGIGSLNCFLWTMFPSWERIWGILNKPMFLLSAIIYIYEEVPAAYQDFLWYNPLVHITGMMRTGFYPNYEADFISIGYVLGIGLITFITGLFLLFHYYRNLLE